MNHYRRDGTPEPDVRQWAKEFKEANRRVALNKFSTPDGRKVEVSTVFLGLNHQFGDGPPLIFETMVFGGDLDGEQERYSTEAEAIEGHKAMIVRVQQTLSD